MAHIEYEATFFPVIKDDIRQRLQGIGARCVKEEFKQERICFDVTDACQWEGAWIRVRDEEDQITMTLKAVAQKGASSAIEDQNEIELVINSFDAGVLFLEKLGFRKKSYQETLRERWMLDDVEIVIDEWPWLPPLVEIEGNDEKSVRETAMQLGFAWEDAVFDSVTALYHRQYGVGHDTINTQGRIAFDMSNPFDTSVN